MAAEVARALNAPLDVMVARKVGVPWNREVTPGAVAPGGVYVHHDMARAVGASHEVMESMFQHARKELELLEQHYRGGLSPLGGDGHTLVLVDDGLATGATMIAAVRAARRMGSRHIVVAVPVGSAEAVESLSRDADEVACPLIPTPFRAVGYHYQDFHPVEDEEVLRCHGLGGSEVSP